MYDSNMMMSFFDEKFYASHYMFRDSTYDEALKHYLTYGKYSLYNPSDSFSTTLYISNNLDVAEDIVRNGNHPGIHYIMYGYKENRVTYPVGDDGCCNYTASQQTSKLSSNARIALTLHVFYEDYINVFWEILQGYTFDFDLFITSPSELILLKMKSKLQSCIHINRFIYRKTPNIGRNFGPLLVEFATELGQYDIIGHVHTKKSLYTGQARYDWALNSMSAVLGSPEYLARVFETLMAGDYGLIHATESPDLPFWCYHWLKNFSAGKLLAKEINIEIEDGFINYPVGGMFWARTDAIRQILDKKWEYAEFGQEDGQIDGMLHHAVERMIGVCCIQNNFKMLQWNSVKGTFVDENNPWKNTILTSSKSNSLKSISNYDIISFDIFDTLLFRTCHHPENVRKQLELYFKQYTTIRSLSELDARKRLPLGKDVSLIDIAKNISKHLSITLEHALYLLSQELEADLQNMRSRKSVVALVDYAKSQKKRVIYVSDMYYGTSELLYILKSLEIPEPDYLYVSSEVGLRKDSGQLWNFVRKNEIGSILHFGDNIVSDLQNSSDYGINSIYIPQLKDKIHLVNILKHRDISKEQWKLLFPILEEFGESPFFS